MNPYQIHGLERPEVLVERIRLWIRVAVPRAARDGAAHARILLADGDAVASALLTLRHRVIEQDGLPTLDSTVSVDVVPDLSTPITLESLASLKAFVDRVVREATASVGVAG